MRDIVDGIATWHAAGQPFAIATVVQTWKSAPRQPGAAMAVSAGGDVLGSVSGGCVEGAVYGAAREVLESGQARLETYGVSDDDAIEVGLTCGGIIDVFVAPADAEHYPELSEVLAAVQARRPVAVASTVSGATTLGRHLFVWPDRVSGSLGVTRSACSSTPSLPRRGCSCSARSTSPLPSPASVSSSATSSRCATPD